jgi:hypothetical protein
VIEARRRERAQQQNVAAAAKAVGTAKWVEDVRIGAMELREFCELYRQRGRVH